MTYLTYMEMPVEVTWDWDEDEVEIRQVELRNDHGAVIATADKDLPVINLERLLTGKQLENLQKEIKSQRLEI